MRVCIITLFEGIVNDSSLHSFLRVIPMFFMLFSARAFQNIRADFIIFVDISVISMLYSCFGRK